MEWHCLLLGAHLTPPLISSGNALTGTPKDVPHQCPRLLSLDPIRLAIKINHHIKNISYHFLACLLILLCLPCSDIINIL